jgi:hypothetical protein
MWRFYQLAIHRKPPQSSERLPEGIAAAAVVERSG